MAKIKMNGTEVEAADGENIQEPVEALGIPFSCKDGRCGTCLINVKEGQDNLSDLNDKETDFGLVDKSQRLACQCQIKSGEIEIESGY